MRTGQGMPSLYAAKPLILPIDVQEINKHYTMGGLVWVRLVIHRPPVAAIRCSLCRVGPLIIYNTYCVRYMDILYE